MNKIKNTKGITLMSLVVTIIILLILAGVSVAFLTGENGLINEASTAAEATKKANAKERLQAELLTIQAKKLSNGEQINLSSLDEKKEALREKGIEVADTGSPRKVTLDGYTFNVKDNLTIEGDGTSTGTTGGSSTGGTISTNSELAEFLSNTNHELTLEDVFSSETAMDEILKSNNNIDYILSNKEKYGNYILNNTISMKKFASNEYALNKMILSDDWRNAILSSETAIAALDQSKPITVPRMTSNTSPKGRAYASSSYGSHIAFYAFNQGDDYWLNASGTSFVNQYVAYDFGEPVWVYKVVSGVSNGKNNASYVIEASNDNTNWDTVVDKLYQGSQVTSIANSTSQRYRYYRLRYVSGGVCSGSGNTIVYYLQFYGK